MTVGTVAGLWRYPVKSMGGEELSSSRVDLRALHADRLWAVRDLELGAVTAAVSRLAERARRNAVRTGSRRIPKGSS